jgi:3-oxoacyl-(acyl-carrier-protein) synthase
MKRRVVVTGLGLVTPCGNDVASTWAALMRGESGADFIKNSTPKGIRSRLRRKSKTLIR